LRYQTVETVSFTDSLGVTRPVKEVREIPAYDTRAIIARRAEEHLDEFATRTEVFGQGYEGETYRIWEANAVALADAGYDLASIQSLKVPPL
jgi:hypothetical protein